MKRICYPMEIIKSDMIFLIWYPLKANLREIILITSLVATIKTEILLLKIIKIWRGSFKNFVKKKQLDFYESIRHGKTLIPFFTFLFLSLSFSFTLPKTYILIHTTLQTHAHTFHPLLTLYFRKWIFKTVLKSRIFKHVREFWCDKNQYFFQYELFWESSTLFISKSVNQNDTKIDFTMSLALINIS